MEGPATNHLSGPLRQPSAAHSKKSAFTAALRGIFDDLRAQGRHADLAGLLRIEALTKHIDEEAF